MSVQTPNLGKSQASTFGDFLPFGETVHPDLATAPGKQRWPL